MLLLKQNDVSGMRVVVPVVLDTVIVSAVVTVEAAVCDCVAM